MTIDGRSPEGGPTPPEPAALTTDGSGSGTISLFFFAQPIATVLGGVGVFEAGVLTFRSAHNTRISAEKTALKDLEHQRSVARDEKARYERQFADQQQNFETTLAEQAKVAERNHHRELVRDLRSRYTTCAEQLAHSSAAIRLAGVYALTSLADDWKQLDEADETQVAIDLLRAYLRTPNTPRQLAVDGPYEYDAGEFEVRKTVLLTVHKRRRTEELSSKSWKDFECSTERADLSGMDLNRANLSRADLTGAKLTDAKLFNADLTGAKLAGAELTGTNLSRTDMTGANLTDTKLNRAKLAGVNLEGANLTGMNLSGANLTDAKLTDADLTGIRYTTRTRWPENFTPPPSHVEP